jgi:hypothetical protein
VSLLLLLDSHTGTSSTVSASDTASVSEKVSIRPGVTNKDTPTMGDRQPSIKASSYFSDNPKVTDTSSLRGSATFSLSNTALLTDALKQAVTVFLDNRVSFTESQPRSAGIYNKDNVGFSETASIRVANYLKDDVGFSETINRLIGSYFKDTTNTSDTGGIKQAVTEFLDNRVFLTDSQPKSAGVYNKDNVGFSESLSSFVASYLKDNLYVSDSPTILGRATLSVSDTLQARDELREALAIYLKNDVSVTDSSTRTGAGSIRIQDDVVLSETISRFVQSLIKDNVQSSDAQSLLLRLTGFSDTVSSSDSAILGVGVRGLSDSTLTSDSLGTPALLVNIADAISAITTLRLGFILSDIAQVTDQATTNQRIDAYTVQLENTVRILDALTIGLTLVDTLKASDSFRQKAGITTSDTVNQSEKISSLVSLLFSNSIAATEKVNAGVGARISDSLAPVIDNISQNIGVLLRDNRNVTDALRIASSLVIKDTASINDLLGYSTNQSSGLNPSDVAKMIEILAIKVALSISSPANASELLGLGVTKPVSDGVSTTDRSLRLVGIPTSSNVGMSDTKTFAASARFSIQEAVQVSQALSLLTSIGISDRMNLTDLRRLYVGLTNRDIIKASESPLGLGLGLSDFLSISDPKTARAGIVTLDQIIYNSDLLKAAGISNTDNVRMSDITSLIGRASKSIEDVIRNTDSFSPSFLQTVTDSLLVQEKLLQALSLRFDDEIGVKDRILSRFAEAIRRIAILFANESLTSTGVQKGKVTALLRLVNEALVQVEEERARLEIENSVVNQRLEQAAKSKKDRLH